MKKGYPVILAMLVFAVAGLWFAVRASEAPAPMPPQPMVQQPGFLTLLNDGKVAYSRGDFQTAMKILKPLAEKGSAEAASVVGAIIRRTDGDRKEAADWLRRAAVKGNKEAQFVLAMMYETGEGVPIDYEEAYFWGLLVFSKGDGPAPNRNLAPARVEAVKRRAAQWKPEPDPTAQFYNRPLQ